MPFLSQNVQLGPAFKLSPWRKIALGTWRTAGDPSVYGVYEIEIEAGLAYIEKLKRESGARVTISHLVGRAMAEVLKRHPDINCVFRWGRLYPRKNVDVFFQVASDNQGKDLSGMTIRNADHKSMPQIANEMDEKVAAIRQKGDPGFKKMKQLMGLFPGWLTRYLLDVSGWLMYSLNLWSPLMGVPKDPFGSLMITNIGSLGLDMAFAPLVPYSRIPLLVAVGAVKEKPVVRNGQIVPAKVITLCATFDHRLIDGMHAAHMSKTMTKIMLNPEQELGGVSAPKNEEGRGATRAPASPH